MKIFVCKTWIMNTLKHLFAIHELWNYENICLQYMNYEIFKYCTLETLRNTL